jgi:hypothetical protein
VLLTDGMHNSPHFSSAQQAVPKLRENGVRVYALGVGDATEVDIPTLDDIATGTGGRSYAVGTDQPNEIEAALVEINAEVRGGLIDSLPVDLPDTGTGVACKKLEGHLHPGGKRPPWKAVAELLALSRATTDGTSTCTTRACGRCGSRGEGRRPMLVHTVASGELRGLALPARPRWRPGGHRGSRPRPRPQRRAARVLARRRPRTRLVDPDPGTPRPGPAIRCRVVARVENKRLHTYATARASALLGETVPVEAGAFYRLPLTGLHVTARLTTPGGAQVAFTLTDVDGTGEDTGVYRGAFTATEIGRYHGAITIEGAAGAQMALGLTRLVHLEDEGPVDLTSDAPPFRRTIPVQVLVRRRGTEVEEDEREKKHAQPDAGIWERPTRLSSYVPDTAQSPASAAPRRTPGARSGVASGPWTSA